MTTHDDAPRGTTALDALLADLSAYATMSRNDLRECHRQLSALLNRGVITPDEYDARLKVVKIVERIRDYESRIAEMQDALEWERQRLANLVPASTAAGEYWPARLLKVGDSILRHGAWQDVLAVKRDGDVVHVTVNDRITPLPYHGNQELRVITAKVADAAQPEAARAKLSKAQRKLLRALADGKIIGRAQSQVAYSVRGWNEHTSFQTITTEPLITEGLVKEVPGPEHDPWQYRVLELTEAGRKAGAQ